MRGALLFLCELRFRRTGLAVVALVLSAFWPGFAAGQMDPVAASVERHLITERDLDYYVFEMRLADPSLEDTPGAGLRRSVLSSVVDEYLLYRRFWVATLEPPEGEIQAAVDSGWRRYRELAGGTKRLETAIELAGMDSAAVRNWMSERAEMHWTIRGGIIALMDSAYFDLPEESPRTASRFLLSGILLKPAFPGDEPAWEDARARALLVRQEIRAGSGFDEAARTWSEDPATGPAGGDLGWVEAGVLDPAILDTLRTSEIDEVTSPVRTRDGYQLLQIRDYDTPKRAAYMQEWSDIKRRVLKQAREESEIQLAPGYRLEPVPEPREPAPAAFWELPPAKQEERAGNSAAEGKE